MKKSCSRKNIVLSIVAILTTIAALVYLSLARAQGTPPPEPEKTAREIQLERELAACQAEVAVLRLPPAPPPDEDAAYLQSLQELEQQIEHAQQQK